LNKFIQLRFVVLVALKYKSDKSHAAIF